MRIYQINVSSGGVPKRPVPVGEVTRLGLRGDVQLQRHVHGGPYRALSLFSLELIERLCEEGHPIAPGTTGENITVTGFDWDAVKPGLRVRLGEDVRIELTAFAGPCQTISSSFSHGRFNRINQRVAPGWSRVYAKVLAEGTIRTGDSGRLDGFVAATFGPADLRIDGIGQVAVRVDDLPRSLAYYRDVLGLRPDESLGASDVVGFTLGHVELLLQGPSCEELVPLPAGRLYFQVDNVEAAHDSVAARGVTFEVGPRLLGSVDGVESWIAYFRDPDGNRLALIEERAAA